MKQGKWFKGGVSSLLIVAVFLITIGISACENPNDGGGNDKPNTGTQKFLVKVASDNVAQGSVTAKVNGEAENIPVAGKEVEKDKVVVFTAKPKTGFVVDKWMDGTTDVTAGITDNGAVKKAVLTITVKKALDIKVIFKAVPKHLVKAKGVANGKVKVKIEGAEAKELQDAGEEIPEGSAVTFIAEPSSGFEVDKWMDGATDVTTGLEHDRTQYPVTNLSKTLDIKVTFKAKQVKTLAEEKDNITITKTDEKLDDTTGTKGLRM